MASVSGHENQPTFERLWHDCKEEEGKTSGKVIKENNPTLAAKTKNFKKPFPQQKKGKKPQGKFSDMSKVECYKCHKFGHFAKICKQNKKKPKRRFQASAAEADEEEEEPKKKKKTKTNKDEEPRREYYLIFALTGSFTDCATSWLVDSGASRHR